ncbi:copper chaperone PCu(A)C [Streptomyces sp. NPDC057302]|uniref:copper chaperone PCu(A)C n=1 Tax=Streptomyces sp. NPDC057302 TaxID=3346094 RepID=UPI00364430E7
MSRSLRRGAIAATAIAFSLASLAACGAGNNAQTHEIKPDNAATAVGDIKIQNAMVITQPDLKSTGPAVIAATIFNNGSTDQTLTGIKVNGTGKTAKITPAKDDKASKRGGPLTIPAGGSVVIGGKDNATAVLPSSREAVKDGNAQPVTFAFSKTGDVKMKTFVVPAESYFKKWGPTEVPEAPDSKPSTKPTGVASGEPNEGATEGANTDPSGQPSGQPSGSASGAANNDPSGAASDDAGTAAGSEH